MDNSPSKPKKTRKSRRGRSVKNINTLIMEKRLMNVLERETNHLLEKSYAKKLDEGDVSALLRYLRFLRDYKKIDEDDLENMTDEQLKKLT